MTTTAKILLASKSPRRKQLLSELGFEFDIVTQDIEESFPDDLAKQDVPEYLACKKAAAVADQLLDGQVILASDTIVLMNDVIYHKPKDAKDAFRILRDLSNNVHQVITGVCLLSKDKKASFSDISEVHFSAISDEEINNYIEQYQPFDKAGAYAIQEWIGMAKIKKIVGSYHNIVGLPTHKVYEALIRF